MTETEPYVDPPSVSVIVTTMNSARTLDPCLLSVRRQSQPVELIVADNGSTDDTQVIAARYADRVLVGGPERSAQRNLGMRYASGRYILILDADMLLAPDVVEVCLAAIDSSPAVVIPEHSFGVGFWTRCKAFERSFYAHDLTTTAVRFFRRGDVLALGGYDEAMTGAEDWDLSMRICGARAPAFAATFIEHDEGRQTLANLFRKKFYYGHGLRLFLAKHGAQAFRRLNPARGSLVGNFPSLLRHPRLGLGLVIMKSVELTGAVAGMVPGGARSPNNVYRFDHDG